MYVKVAERINVKIHEIAESSVFFRHSRTLNKASYLFDSALYVCAYIVSQTKRLSEKQLCKQPIEMM